MSKTLVRCQCGAVYEREKHKLQYRDRDTAECRICKRELASWSGAYFYEFKLIEMPDGTKVEYPEYPEQGKGRP